MAKENNATKGSLLLCHKCKSFVSPFLETHLTYVSVKEFMPFDAIVVPLETSKIVGRGLYVKIAIAVLFLLMKTTNISNELK